MKLAQRLLAHAQAVAAGTTRTETIYFRAPLFEGNYLGLVWLPGLQPYADAVLDAVADVLREWAAQGWHADQAGILAQLEPKRGVEPYLEYLGEIPLSKITVVFTR